MYVYKRVLLSAFFSSSNVKFNTTATYYTYTHMNEIKIKYFIEAKNQMNEVNL